MRIRPKSIKFPAFSLVIREFDAENGSRQTASSATQSALFHYNLEMAVDPRVTRGFCARCEPEKAISLQMVRIPRVFSPSAEEAVRFTAGADFVHLSPLCDPCAATLVRSERVYLRRPFQRQIDPVE